MAGRAHQVVILVLDRRRIDRYLSSELLEAFGERGTPEDREVRLGAWTEVVESLEEAEACLRDLVTAVEEATTDRLSYPRGVTSEDLVV